MKRDFIFSSIYSFKRSYFGSVFTDNKIYKSYISETTNEEVILYDEKKLFYVPINYCKKYGTFKKLDSKLANLLYK